MRRTLLRSALAVAASVSAVAAAGTLKEPEITLVPPMEIIKTTALPADKLTALTKEKAIALAEKYSGFDTDKTVEAALVLYSDTEKDDSRKPAWPYEGPVAAWLISFPNASVEGKDADGRALTVPCPVSVAIHADTGRFLGACGKSAEKWVKGRKGPADIDTGAPNAPLYRPVSFPLADETPSLTVRKVLQAYHGPNKHGQFFVRFVKVRNLMEDGKPVLAWMYSERGALLLGFSVPPGYDGPALYGTCCDHFLIDATGERRSHRKY